MASEVATRCSATVTCLSFASSPTIYGAPRRQLLLEQNVLRRHPPQRQLAFDQQQMIGIDRLGEKIERAFLHCCHGVLDAAEGRHHNHRYLGIQLLRGTQHAEAVPFRQSEVRQHDAGTARTERLHRLVLIACLDHHMALPFEGVA